MRSRTNTRGKSDDFKGELRFTSKTRLSPSEASAIAAAILRGEDIPEGITVRRFEYGNKKRDKEASEETLQRGDFSFAAGFSPTVSGPPPRGDRPRRQTRTKKKGAL